MNYRVGFIPLILMFFYSLHGVSILKYRAYAKNSVFSLSKNEDWFAWYTKDIKQKKICTRYLSKDPSLLSSGFSKDKDFLIDRSVKSMIFSSIHNTELLIDYNDNENETTSFASLISNNTNIGHCLDIVKGKIEKRSPRVNFDKTYNQANYYNRNVIHESKSLHINPKEESNLEWGAASLEDQSVQLVYKPNGRIWNCYLQENADCEYVLISPKKKWLIVVYSSTVSPGISFCLIDLCSLLTDDNSFECKHEASNGRGLYVNALGSLFCSEKCFVQNGEAIKT